MKMRREYVEETLRLFLCKQVAMN